MKRELCNLYLLILVSSGITVMMESKDPILTVDESLPFNEALGVCLSTRQFSALECLNRGALSALQSLSDRDDLGFGHVRLERIEGPYGRDLLDLDYDPKDFGNVVKAAARLMERRSLRWNLDHFYPGLCMRVGPMLNGEGTLEFVLDERVAGNFNDRHASAGRQMARHLLLPLLLGFKLNLASLIPLLFGVVLLIAKKSLFLAKVALLLSGFLGWNSLFSNVPTRPTTSNGFNHGYGYEVPVDAPFYGGHFPRPYRGGHGEYLPYGRHVIREVVDVYGTEEVGAKRKNFAWSKEN